MPATTSQFSFFIDADWINRIMKKRDHLVAQREEIDAQISEIDTKLAEIAQLKVSVAKLIGEKLSEAGSAMVAQSQNAKETKPRRAKKLPRLVKVGGKLVSFASEIKKVVDPAPLGVSYDAIKEAVLSGHLGEKMRQNPKGFYTAIARLGNEGYVKHKGHLFKQEHFEALMNDVNMGLVDDIEGEQISRKPSMVDAVLAVINDASTGLAPKDVIDALSERTEIESSKSNVYNALGRLLERGQLTKDDGLYYPVKQKALPFEAGPKDSDLANLLG